MAYDDAPELRAKLESFINMAKAWTPGMQKKVVREQRRFPPPLALTQRCQDYVATLSKEERSQLAALIDKMLAAKHIEPPDLPFAG